jgi:hypothetical protein
VLLEKNKKKRNQATILTKSFSNRVTKKVSNSVQIDKIRDLVESSINSNRKSPTGLKKGKVVLKHDEF